MLRTTRLIALLAPTVVAGSTKPYPTAASISTVFLNSTVTQTETARTITTTPSSTGTGNGGSAAAESTSIIHLTSTVTQTITSTPPSAAGASAEPNTIMTNPVSMTMLSSVSMLMGSTSEAAGSGDRSTAPASTGTQLNTIMTIGRSSTYFAGPNADGAATSSGGTGSASTTYTSTSQVTNYNIGTSGPAAGTAPADSIQNSMASGTAPGTAPNTITSISGPNPSSDADAGCNSPVTVFVTVTAGNSAGNLSISAIGPSGTAGASGTGIARGHIYRRPRYGRYVH